LSQLEIGGQHYLRLSTTAYLMIKEKFLKIFLATPVLDEISEFSISLLIKKIGLRASLNKLQKNLNPVRKKSKYKYPQTEQFYWLIQVSSPSGIKSKLWGDTYFADEIALALRKLNQKATVIYRDQNIENFESENSVVLNLRGLLPQDTLKNKLNIIWIISHPNQLTKRELGKYQLIFAASESWSESMSRKWRLNIFPLMQATNPNIFNTSVGEANSNKNILFVGNTRKQFRDSVRVASECSEDFRVIGSGWKKYLAQNFIETEFIENTQLSKKYREANVVLADHWSDMAENGFISNRIFDSVASGARVISDYVPGSKELFGSSLLEYRNENELRELLSSDLDSQFGNQVELDQNAIKVQKTENFDQRAIALLASVQKEIRKSL
jgi:hypothetical protein